MTKDVFSIHIADVSAFARQVGRALHERALIRPEPPGHTELLNLIARTQGQRNWQALRQQLRAVAAPPRAAPVAQSVPAQSVEPLSVNARKALSQFDAQGRLVRWPAKYSVQKLVMWAL